MNTRLAILLSGLAALSGFAQGFVNLDFEATVLGTNDHTVALTSAAFPGWTVYRGGIAQSLVGHNGTITFSGVSLCANTLSSRPLSGNFHASLISDPRDLVDVSIAQTGQIPLGMGTLQFRTGNFFPIPAGSLTVSFAGTPLLLQPVSQGGGYTLWSADISAYDGLTGELRFTALPTGFTWDTGLDNIMFSPVPEPSTWALLALGSALFACAAHRRRNR